MPSIQGAPKPFQKAPKCWSQPGRALPLGKGGIQKASQANEEAQVPPTQKQPSLMMFPTGLIETD